MEHFTPPRPLRRGWCSMKLVKVIYIYPECVLVFSECRDLFAVIIETVTRRALVGIRLLSSDL